MAGVLRENSSIFSFLLRLWDVGLIFLVSFLAFQLYLKEYLGHPAVYSDYKYPVIAGLILSAFTLYLSGLYRPWRGEHILNEVRVITAAVAAIFLGLAVISVMTKTSALYSRVWFGLWCTLSWSALVLSRLVLRSFLSWVRSEGLNYRKIAIVGSGDMGAQVIERIAVSPWAGLKIVGVFGDIEVPARYQEKDVFHCLDHRNVIEFVNDNEIDQVWIAMPLSGKEIIDDVLHQLRHSTVDIRYIPDVLSFRMINHSISEVAGLPVVNLSVTPMDGVNGLVKEIEDRFLGLIIFILILPLMIVISIAVKFGSPGPILFKQLRHGWDGRPIKVYKFRTMVCHTEPEGVVSQATENDCRVTRVGRFLRKTSLDELPQFFNVLQGRMSIVGPRPHALEHNMKYMDQIDGYMQRHKVKPGITGWAQINGYRGQTDTLEKMRKRIEYDLFYIENWSLSFDLRIILMTIFKGFVDKNAY